MRDNIADVDFNKTENLTMFHNRVASFINNNISKTILDKGYLCKYIL